MLGSLRLLLVLRQLELVQLELQLELELLEPQIAGGPPLFAFVEDSMQKLKKKQTWFKISGFNFESLNSV